MLTLACACGGIGELWLIGTIITTVGAWLGIRAFRKKEEHHEHSH
jgi:hypothetical protein